MSPNVSPHIPRCRSKFVFATEFYSIIAQEKELPNIPHEHCVFSLDFACDNVCLSQTIKYAKKLTILTSSLLSVAQQMHKLANFH